MSRSKPAHVLFALLTSVFLMIVAPAIAQTTWYVDDDAPNDPGPGDVLVSDPSENGSAEHPFDAIREGIDAAVNGDTVLVLNGWYDGVDNRDLDYGGKLLTVQSENGPDCCIIDCQGSEDYQRRGFYFHNGETADAVVDGFTITDGYQQGGAIACDGSSPTVINCKFIGNRYSGMKNTNHSSPTVINCRFIHNLDLWSGGGMDNTNHSSPTVINCRFSGNFAIGGGGMENGDSSNPTVINCTFSANEADWSGGGGMRNWGSSSPTVINCTFSRNSVKDGAGGGIKNQGSSPAVINCTFSRNSADDDGGGMHNSASSNPTVMNCIFWGDSPDEIYVSDGSVTVSYSDVEGGWTGYGNIDANPQFVDPDIDECHLRPGSPCIDAADNTALPVDVTTDVDGNPRFVDVPCVADTGDPPGADAITDMGALEVVNNDCNQNGSSDVCDVVDGSSEDCNRNAVPDECEFVFVDCNGNSQSDTCDILDGASEDCNANGIPDECDIADGVSDDCQSNGVPDECEIIVLDQWASTVIDFSSQWGSGGYSAAQVLGPPDTWSYADHDTAWCPSSQNGTIEYVLLGYDTPVYATGVTIRETLGNGYVTQVNAREMGGELQTVWTGTDPSEPGQVVDFLVEWPITDFLVDGLKVTITTDATDGWEEMDALQLHGVRSPDVNDNGVPDECELAGDVDGDGDVDLSDLGALLASYDKCIGHPEYNAGADFNDDGCVDLIDLTYLLPNYGVGT